MQQKSMWITFSIGTVYILTAMCVMLFAASNRVIKIEDTTQDQRSAMNTGMTRNTWKKLTLAPEEAEEDIIIPLRDGVKAENVTIENHYMQKEIWIGIEETDKNFYAKEKIAGNLSQIENAIFGRDDGCIWLKFLVNDVFECESVLEENRLCIKLVEPKEMYERIVVIDPWYDGGMAIGTYTKAQAEKVLLDIGKQLEEKAAASGFVKLYHTWTEGKAPTLEERERLLEEVDADFYIGIGLNSAEEVSVYGVETIYNGTYFIPETGSVELADSLEKNVTIQVSGRANGLTQAQEADMIVQRATVPAALVKVGYATNEKEAELLRMQEYRAAVAEGIFQAINEIYAKAEAQQGTAEK